MLNVSFSSCSSKTIPGVEEAARVAYFAMAVSSLALLRVAFVGGPPHASFDEDCRWLMTRNGAQEQG